MLRRVPRSMRNVTFASNCATSGHLEEIMWTTALSLIPAVLLCSALPALAQSLPEGEGKDLVAAQCNSCHDFYARLGAGYTPEGWKTVMRMMANHGVEMTPDQVAAMTAYLAKNFPEKGKPAAVVVPGTAKISI